MESHDCACWCSLQSSTSKLIRATSLSAVPITELPRLRVEPARASMTTAAPAQNWGLAPSSARPIPCRPVRASQPAAPRAGEPPAGTPFFPRGVFNVLAESNRVLRPPEQWPRRWNPVEWCAEVPPPTTLPGAAQRDYRARCVSDAYTMTSHSTSGGRRVARPRNAPRHIDNQSSSRSSMLCGGSGDG
jgi:hypothetical protein